MSRVPEPGVIAPGVDSDGSTAALSGRPRPEMSGLTGQDSWLSQNRALLIPYGLILILLAAAAIRAPGRTRDIRGVLRSARSDRAGDEGCGDSIHLFGADGVRANTLDA